MRELMSLFAPIPDEELPHLRTFMQRGVRTAALMGVIGAPLYAAVQILLDGTEPLRTALVCMVFGTYYGLILGGAHLDPRGRYVQWAVVATAAGALGVFGFVDLALDSPGATAHLAPSTVVVIAVIFPWKPRYSMILGAFATFLPLWVAPNMIGASTAAFVFNGFVFTTLAASGNQLHRRLWLQLERAQDQLVAADRMSTLGRMTSGIAHELKTPIAAAGNSLERIATLSAELAESIGHPDVSEADLREIAAELRETSQVGTRGVARASRFVGAIREQTVGMQAREVMAFDVGDRIRHLLMLVEHTARRAHVSLEVDVTQGLMLTGDPGRFDQIVVNLVTNAMEALEEGQATSSIRIQAREENGEVILRVEDEGRGVPESLRERIFEPLVTTKGATGGTGLGLAICRDIAEGAFGGSLELLPSEGGAVFEARLRSVDVRAAPGRVWAPARSPLVAAAS